jgi:chromate transport protein ChrA
MTEKNVWRNWLVFFKVGVIGFSGPAAHMMQDEVVVKKMAH